MAVDARDRLDQARDKQWLGEPTQTLRHINTKHRRLDPTPR